MKIDYTGKVALVTGSSCGIGEGVVKRLSEMGAQVVVTGRNESNVKRVADECYRISPRKLKPLEVVADLTVEEDVRRLVQSTIDMFGRIDLLVNNAGYCQITSLLDPESLKVFDNVWRLDVRSVIQMTLESVPHLEKTKGNIVNISSICALKPLANFYAYCTCKSALDGFTKCAALELGAKKIRVNGINSGGVKSNFLAAIGMNEEQIRQQENLLRKSSPLNLLGEPTDIADLVAYIGSDYAKYMTGSCLVIDGGSLYSNITTVVGE